MRGKTPVLSDVLSLRHRGRRRQVLRHQARRHLDAADRARDTYVRRLYRTDPADPRHYHLVIDSTALPLDTVTEIILSALSAAPTQLAGREASPAPG